MIKKIPEFRDESEEARFWDSQDAADFLSELEDDRSTVFVRPEAGVVTLGGEAWQNLLGAARRRRTTPARLLQRLLAEEVGRACGKRGRRAAKSSKRACASTK